MAEVSSWFTDQLNLMASEPKRVFTMAGSDHSARVKKWPTMRRDIDQIKPTNIVISLSNVDGLYNHMRTALYTMVASCHIEAGFTHPESGDELVKLHTGIIEKVKFTTSKTANFYIKDKLYDMSLRKIGSTETQVDFASQIPSEIAWTMVTCYGGLSTVQSDSNTDIHWEKFEKWAGVFSADSVVATANFQGELVVEGLKQIMDYTDSFHWVDGDGRLVFERFSEVSSLDFLIEQDKHRKFSLDIDAETMVNRQYVDYNYSVASEYWQNQVSAVDSLSVNSFRLHENVLQSPNIWYTTSGTASNIALRRINRLSQPPQNFKISMPLFGLHREPGNTVRITDSFFNVSSGAGWHISEQKINLDNFTIEVSASEALVANGFYLDINDLDGDELLL